MSHRNAQPCGYADGLTLPVSWMLRGSRHKSSSHLKDFLRSAQGQGGGGGEHTGDWKTESAEGEGEEGDEVRERDDSPLWPCNYIQSLLGAERGGGPRKGRPLIGQRRSGAGGGGGSERK